MTIAALVPQLFRSLQMIIRLYCRAYAGGIGDFMFTDILDGIEIGEFYRFGSSWHRKLLHVQNEPAALKEHVSASLYNNGDYSLRMQTLSTVST
jgi:hypothetical protein